MIPLPGNKPPIAWPHYESAFSWTGRREYNIADAEEKADSYRRAGSREYLLWRTEDEAFDWWILEEDTYRPLQPGSDGILRSRTFPGLWLDPQALLAEDGGKLLATLQERLKSQEHAAFMAELGRRRS